MTNFLLNLVTLRLENVMRVDDNYWAAAKLRIGEGQPLLVMVGFRAGCNDWPQNGQFWEVELTDQLTENGAIVAKAMIRR